MIEGFNFIAVVGSQRSGTTLLAQMLGAHSSCIVVDEDDGLYDWIYPMIHSWKNGKTFEEVVDSSRRKYVSNKGRYIGSGIDDSCVKNVVLKAPNLTFYWNDLPSIFKNISVVYVHRDIRSIVASMKKLTNVPIVQNQIRLLSRFSYITKEFEKEIIELNSGNTSECVKRALIALIKNSFEQKFIAEGMSTMSLNYENLVLSPDSTVETVLEFLGQDYEEACVNYNGVYQGMAPGNTSRIKSISKGSLTLWKDVLSELEIKCIEDVTTQFVEMHPHVQDVGLLLTTE